VTAILPAVSKRTRGSQRQVPRRPGTRPATSRPASERPRSPSRPTAISSTESVEIVPAAEAAPRTAAPATADPRLATRSAHHRVRAKPGSVLAARAATEYVYVIQDLRKILLVAAGLFGILVVLWIVLVVMGISPLY